MAKIKILFAGKKFFPIFMVFVAFFVLFVSASGSAKGPLLFQAHYTNGLSSISLADALNLIRGDLSVFQGSSVKLYVDKNIAKFFAAEYPDTLFIECDAVSAPPSADRKALLISDLRGLVPSMKMLSVDSVFPWGESRDDYVINTDIKYPLLKEYAEPWEANQHITVVQTGVTAMSRAFIRAINEHGDLERPVAGVRHITSAADISMTSNEVSFTDNCKYPLPDRMQFCSPRKYFNILQSAGFNIIELTGNHNNDYGADANRETIDLYEKEGIRFFGGGRNKAEAESVLYVKKNGLTFAFTGSNQWGPDNAWATDKRAGAARFSPDRFVAAVKEAVKRADIVFVTVQWGNEDNPVPHKEQTRYFRLASELGAHIMVSSSAHRAMGLEFHNGRFISYGLGNFMFDQMQTINHRRGLIARHHFYGKRHVQTELIPYLMYNHSEPRIVYGSDAEQLFDYVFKYSLGEVFERR